MTKMVGSTLDEMSTRKPQSKICLRVPSCSKTVFLLFVIIWGISAPSTCAVRRVPWHKLEETKYSFEDYVQDFDKNYTTEEEYHERKAIFHTNLQSILDFNRRGESWKMGVNNFTDLRDVEHKALRGYRRAHTLHVRSNPHPMMSEHVSTHTLEMLPTDVDWRKTSAVTAVKDQSSCGSCWAFATSEVLESFYFLATGKRMLVSPQQIASCTVIPYECLTQGLGGCEGSTQILAYHSIMQRQATLSEYQYPYTSWTGKNYSCLQLPNPSSLRVIGYKVIPMNSYEALMDAVANVGPVTISVDASQWKFYESGVFTGCSATSVDIDHAVQLVGYGTDKSTGQPFWIVRNSWNIHWGEDGYIRVFRNANPSCSKDPGARDCMGGPTTQTVCGDCGILYDSSYPIISNTTATY